VTSQSLKVLTGSGDHIRAHHHLLAHFAGGQSPRTHIGELHNPEYISSVARLRPKDVHSPARRLGELHRALRSLEAAGAPVDLPTLAFQFTSLQTLLANLPEADSPKRQRFGRLWSDLLRSELDGWLAAHLRATDVPRLQGLERGLRERLEPLTTRLGFTTATLTVWPCEALSEEAPGIRTATGWHVAIPPGLNRAWYPLLLTLMAFESRPALSAVFDQLAAGRRHQLLLDGAMTATYHLLVRAAPEQLEGFKDFARRRYAQTARHPSAAVEGLRSWALVPEEAVVSLRRRLGDRIEELHY